MVGVLVGLIAMIGVLMGLIAMVGILIGLIAMIGILIGLIDMVDVLIGLIDIIDVLVSIAMIGKSIGAQDMNNNSLFSLLFVLLLERDREALRLLSPVEPAFLLVLSHLALFAAF